MTAPAAWIREAYERRDILAAQGVHIVIVPSAWGVTMWPEGADVEAIGRAWSVLEGAGVNPLIPTIETLCTKLRRSAS
jgi:hypothetical protein